ncbi:MAG: hypothetical protein ABL876_00125 [Chitinophagaceae bacterium]
MADGVFNIAKGRFGELFNRVDSNDPANSVLVVSLYSTVSADDTLNDATTLAVVVSGGSTEATFTNYARVIWTDTNIALGSPDNTNNRFDYPAPNPIWTSAGGATNNTLAKLVISYDSDSTGGADSAIIPMTYHDFVITTNGGNLTGTVNGSGFGRAA